jgi:hypothetical protein
MQILAALGHYRRWSESWMDRRGYRLLLAIDRFLLFYPDDPNHLNDNVIAGTDELLALPI